MEVPNTQFRMEHLPSEVQEKLKLFRQQEELINSLEAQLEKLQREHAQLENELAPYRDNIIHTSQTSRHNTHNSIIDYSLQQSPIHRCPAEILSHIFEYYVSQKHEDIRKLLLVCKHWYHLTMNNPILWAQIQTTSVLDRYEGYKCFEEFVTPYIRACIERSQGLPLDIELDLRELPDLQEYFNHLFLPDFSELDKIVGPESIPIIQRTVAHPRWPEVPWVYNYQFLRDLANSVKRWRHLSLYPPEDPRSAVKILKQFGLHNAPIASLEIKDVWDLADYAGPRLYSHLLPSLSKLKGVNFEWTEITSWGGSLTSLEYIKIRPDSLLNLRPLNSCVALKTLLINVIFGNIDEAPVPLTLSLPALRHLTIVGPANHFAPVSFICPVLERLNIEEKLFGDYVEPRRMKDGSISFTIIPGISARRVYWTMDSWDEDRFLQGIDQILSLSQETEIFELEAKVGSTVLEAIVQLHKEPPRGRIKHIRVAGEMTLAESCEAVEWFEKWASDNSYAFKNDSLP